MVITGDGKPTGWDVLDGWPTACKVGLAVLAVVAIIAIGTLLFTLTDGSLVTAVYMLPALSLGLLLATYRITFMRDEARAGLSLIILWAVAIVGVILMFHYLGE